ncbi:hypothetical protein CDL12_12850 [Handroanthus impetiginosus]|uniref:Uncharacterized protein n=1 Tax=Handroanthus impetiginosus TaxID=429701 RepID=A0A2G9HAH7_9LAMI|nr:hypothetical protein CDL12_12850 [Handroanthus impetiginosus]
MHVGGLYNPPQRLTALVHPLYSTPLACSTTTAAASVLLYFDVDKDTANANHIMCACYPTLVHITCFPLTMPSSTLYLCPNCSNPSFSFFDSRRVACNSNDGTMIVFAKDLVKQFLYATKSLCGLESKRSFAARQSAREAIERVACLIANQQPQED